MNTSATADQSEAKLPTILIVEDNPPTMELLKEYFILANEKARAFKEGVDGFLAKKALDYYPLTLQLSSWFKLVAFERKYGKQMKWYK